MAVRQNVFASNAERDNYYKLSRRWSNHYRIYHNLPFLLVMSPESLCDVSTWPIQPIKISDIELARLKKTSIDFTLSNEQDEPLVSIEFDGLQGGFNVGSIYLSGNPPDYSSSWRKTITDLKLKVAHGSFYPFFVVSSQHFHDISARMRITIVDGLIGEVLARRAFGEEMSGTVTATRMGISEEEFSAMDPCSQDEYVRDWAMGLEIETDFKHNPIYTVVARMSHNLGAHFSSISQRFVDSPRLAAAKTLADRRRLFDKEIMIGAECVVRTKRFGDIKRTVWLPNFQTPYFSGYGLSEEIAHLMALERLRCLLTADVNL